MNECYRCCYRRNVPGDAHSACGHPDLNGVTTNLQNIVDILNSDLSSILTVAEKLKIKANPHGVKSGWFMWPFNFDPVWLENCDGFKEKN